MLTASNERPLRWRRSSRLLDREPESIGRLLTHPIQLQTCDVIESLLVRLRSLRSWDDYNQFQRLLFTHVFEIQRALAEATRNVKRLERGRPAREAPSGDWRVEQAVLDRADRQLRSVGDALAWRLFRFDRRVLLALSRNERPGPMINKDGLERELGEVQSLWEREGVFALLHDLTNSLRIADVTRFNADGAFLVEVKKSARVPAAQERRMRRAIDVIMSGAPLPGPGGDSDLFISSVPFRTRLRDLGEGLAMARRDRVAAMRAGRQWVVTCTYLDEEMEETDVEDVLRAADSLRDRQFRRAEMHVARHHLRGLRPDRADAEPMVAPFTIYPFDPRTCALLVCDLLVYDSVMGWDRLEGAFESAGFEVDCQLPDRPEPATDSTAPVLRATRGTRDAIIHWSGMSQMLGELVEPKAFARVVREVIDAGGAFGSGMFTFANERAVWR